MSREPYIPGATTIGMVCKDGVLLASERRYAYGSFVMSKSAKKVFRITDKIGVACAGIVGDMQVLTREARAWMSIYQYERERQATVKNTAKLISNLLSSRRMFPYLAETIIAGLSDGKPELYVLDPIGSLLPDKFSVVGTGAPIAIGVLELDYNEGLSVDEGEPLLLRAVKSAIARDISSGDGVDLMIITEQGIREETPRFA
jgi:proteasome beta subunit